MTAPDMQVLERAERARTRLTPPERNAVHGCNAALAAIRLDGEPVLDEVVARLKELLATDLAVLYAPERADGDWRLSHCRVCGLSSEIADPVRFVESWMNRRGGPLKLPAPTAVRRLFGRKFAPVFDPDRPEPRQRNRSLRPASLTYHENHRNIVGHDQLRALVCDGAALLAWVGGIRSTPFTARERRRLDALIPALQRYLIAERRLRDAALYPVGLVAALESFDVPAFVVQANGRVAHANASAQAFIDARPTGARLAIENALRGAQRDEPRAPRYEVTSIRARGQPPAYLVVQTGGDRDTRASELARAWTLTKRETDVLGLLVGGDSNSLIAAKLGCSLRTVELHVTAILRKARCERRSDVIRRVLGLC